MTLVEVAIAVMTVGGFAGQAYIVRQSHLDLRAVRYAGRNGLNLLVARHALLIECLRTMPVGILMGLAINAMTTPESDWGLWGGLVVVLIEVEALLAVRMRRDILAHAEQTT